MPLPMAVNHQGKSGLEPTSAVMGFLTGELSGSHNLSKATLKAIRKFFTSRRKPPRGWVGPKPHVQTALLSKFAKAVESLLNWQSLLSSNMFQPPSLQVFARSSWVQTQPPMNWRQQGWPKRPSSATSVYLSVTELTQQGGRWLSLCDMQQTAN